MNDRHKSEDDARQWKPIRVVDQLAWEEVPETKYFWGQYVLHQLFGYWRVVYGEIGGEPYKYLGKHRFLSDAQKAARDHFEMILNDPTQI